MLSFYYIFAHNITGNHRAVIFLKTGQQIIWKKTRLTGYVYDFSADYNAIAIADIKDSHKYLMKKKNIV